MFMKRDDKLIRQIELEKRRNFRDNLKFVKIRAEWLKRTSNKEWSKRQKIIIDEVYKRNRHPRLGPKPTA
jgi:hypothetical protein